MSTRMVLIPILSLWRTRGSRYLIKCFGATINRLYDALEKKDVCSGFIVSFMAWR